MPTIPTTPTPPPKPVIVRQSVNDRPQPLAAGTTTPIAPKSTPRHHRLRWSFVTGAIVVLIVLGTTGWLVYRAISVVNTRRLDGTNQKLSFFQQLGHIVTARGEQLQGEAEDRVNFLFLGYGGAGHDGPYLTDTMMVASFRPSTKELALISIPRDLVVDIPGYGYRKINNVLSFGREQEYPGGGEALAVKVVSDLLNIPIQYYARLDFSGFEKVIDRVDGVEVNVVKPFTDYMYPTLDHGYQTIRFKSGTQTMNGDIALKYSRSRHGNNGEGSDFARAKRQQQIIMALRDKLLSFGTLANPLRISDVLGVIGDHSQTNMEVWEMVRLGKMVGDINRDLVINKVIDDGTAGLLHSATGLGGAFILVPKDDTYADIRFLAQHIFLIGQAEREDARILVANASGVTGLGEATVQGLAGFSFHVAKPITLRGSQVTNSVVVDTSGGRFPKTIELLNTYRRATGTFSLVEWQDKTGDTTLVKVVEPESDSVVVNSSVYFPPQLVLVLGQDQPAKYGVPVVIPTYQKPAATNSNTNTATTTKKTTKKKTSTTTSNTNSATNSNANLNTNPTVSNLNTNESVSNTNSTLP